MMPDKLRRNNLSALIEKDLGSLFRLPQEDLVKHWEKIEGEFLEVFSPSSLINESCFTRIERPLAEFKLQT